MAYETDTAFDPQTLFQEIYGRPGSEQEVAAVSGMSPDQISGILNQSLAQFNAQQQQQQPAGIAALPTSTQQVANTPINPNIGVTGLDGGIANIAQQQMASAAPATVQTAAAIDPEVKNFLDYQMAQTPGFLSPAIGYNTVGDYYQAKGIDPYSADQIKFAQEQIDRAKGRIAAFEANDPRVVAPGPRPSYENLAPWANPNWQTETALRRAAEDAMREQAYYSDRAAGWALGGSEPGGAPGAAPTRDPLLKQILGNVDPVTALRAANIMQHGGAYYGQQPGDPQAAALAAALQGKPLPKTVLDKIFPAYKATTQTAAPAPAGTTPAAPAPAPTPAVSSGVTVKDYQGNAFDTGQIKNLAKQVAQNFDMKGSSGAAFTTQGQSIGFDYDQAKAILGKDPSAAEQVMMDIARQLQQKGITDLSKVGVRTYDAEVPTGGFESGTTEMQRITEFYNKDTGEKLGGTGSGYLGNTYTGKGVTNYYLDATPDGKVQIRTEGQDTSDAGVAAMALPLLLGPVLGVQGLLSGVFQNAGLPQLASQALSQGLLSGTTSKLFGGDFGKGFLGGAISPVISTGIGAVLPTDLQGTTLGNFLTKAGGAAAMGALSGGDPSKAIANAALSGIAGAAMDKAGIPSNLAPALVSLIRSGTITPQAAMQMISQMGKKG